ncbi:MAG TPA: hypothetical protein ENN30_02820 [Candidatus Woesearchaeota archaeon]|nr:hypothetical protein [Candidatus Woesearchaeota archaeon]
MTELVAVLSTGKGTWGHVGRLINDGTWDKIVLITNDFGKENFTNEKGAEMIVIDNRQPILELVEAVKKALEGKLKGPEVAVNIVSGDGKEHMAVISALLKSGLAIRFMALTKEGIKEI